jgi:hypothetical protein
MRLVRQAFSITGAFTLILGAVTLSPAQAPSPLSGTWKLNLAKSTYSPANLAPRSTTAVYTVTATDITVSTEGVDAQGRATRSEYTAKLNGKDYPWKGFIDGKPNPNQDAVAVTRIDAHTYHVVNKLKGKTLTTLHIVVAADGKSRTVTTTGMNAQGVKVNHKAWYDKQ